MRKYTLIIGLFLPFFFGSGLLQADEEEENLPLARRIYRERQWRKHWLSIIPHRTNYFLPLTYESSPNNTPYLIEPQPDLDNVEAKFQFSFKVPLWQSVFNKNIDLYFGYTQVSLWQFYNRGQSRFFRDTTYEPEILLTLDTFKNMDGFNLRRLDIALDHQSNGREYPFSRSWNRVYANLFFETRHIVVSVKPWYRIPDPARRDDNPDIYRYLGYGELALTYVRKEKALTVALQNNLRAHGNKGSVRIDFTFLLTRILKGFVQYFNGYGESLLDYNVPTNRIGMGIALSD